MACRWAQPTTVRKKSILEGIGGGVAEDEIVDPLEGEEAASFAASLGMEGRPQEQVNPWGRP